MQGRLMVDPIGDRGPCSGLPLMHLRAESSGTGPLGRLCVLSRCRWLADGADRLHMADVGALKLLVAIAIQSSAVRLSRRQIFAFYLLNIHFPCLSFTYKSLPWSLLAPLPFSYFSKSSLSIDVCIFAAFRSFETSNSLSSSHSLRVRASHC